MMQSAKIFRSLLIVVLISILPAPILGQFGSDLLAFVPEDCQEEQGGQELDDALGCVFASSNLLRCFGLVEVLDADLIPDPADIADCTDIDAPYCEIERECEACNEVIKSLLRCIVINYDGVDARITELVETCPLEC